MPKPEPTKTPGWEHLKSHLSSLMRALYEPEEHRMTGNPRALRKLIDVHETLPEDHPLRDKVLKAALIHGCLYEFEDKLPPKVRKWFKTKLKEREAEPPPPPEPKELPSFKEERIPVSVEIVRENLDWQMGNLPEERLRMSLRLKKMWDVWALKRFGLKEVHLDWEVKAGAIKDGIVTKLTNRLLKDREFVEAFVNSPFNFIFDTTEDALQNKRRLRRAIYQLVDGLVGAWAVTASDAHPLVWALQFAVAHEFGLTESYKFALKILRERDEETKTDLVEKTAFLYETLKPILHRYVRAVYDETQEFLAETGLKELLLVRGLSIPEEQAASLSSREFTPHKMMHLPASSWTTDFKTAEDFADISDEKGQAPVILHIRVPKEAFSLILSTSLSGWGCHEEFEIIVMHPGVQKVLAALYAKKQTRIQPGLLAELEALDAYVKKGAPIL
jgi:hypothetical protein